MDLNIDLRVNIIIRDCSCGGVGVIGRYDPGGYNVHCDDCVNWTEFDPAIFRKSIILTVDYIHFLHWNQKHTESHETGKNGVFFRDSYCQCIK